MIEFLRARQQYPSLVDNAEASCTPWKPGAGKEELENRPPSSLASEPRWMPRVATTPPPSAPRSEPRPTPASPAKPAGAKPVGRLLRSLHDRIAPSPPPKRSRNEPQRSRGSRLCADPQSKRPAPRPQRHPFRPNATPLPQPSDGGDHGPSVPAWRGLLRKTNCADRSSLRL